MVKDIGSNKNMNKLDGRESDLKTERTEELKREKAVGI